MVLCVKLWIDHQQTSNYICIEVAYSKGRPIDSHKTVNCVYRRWQRTVKMQASVNNLDIKKNGNMSPDMYVTVTLCEDWNRPTSRLFATLHHNCYHQVVRKTCFSSIHLSWERIFQKAQRPYLKNINNKLITVTATATTRECLPSETWLAVPIFKDVTCVPNVLVWYTVIWNL